MQRQLPWEVFQSFENQKLPTTDENYASPPRHKASALEFVDDDFTGGNLSGIIRIGMASDESDVTWYSLYWGQNNHKLPNTPLIQVIPKAGHDLEFRLGSVTGGDGHPDFDVSQGLGSVGRTADPYGAEISLSEGDLQSGIGSRAIPYGATHILVYTSNQGGGEMSDPVADEIVDATNGWTLGLPLAHVEDGTTTPDPSQPLQVGPPAPHEDPRHPLQVDTNLDEREDERGNVLGRKEAARYVNKVTASAVRDAIGGVR